MAIASVAEELGLYISVPFCRSKCSFCNFASNVYSASDHERYIDRVCEELRAAPTKAASIGAHLPRVVDSVYLGGGTPSVLEPALLHRVFATLHEIFQVTADAEITMECAPGQIGDDVLSTMVECGVNRVSLGVQSFIDREAATTGRLHNRATTLSDLARLRSAGIHRISLDLIAGLPHQTLESWSESLRILTDTGVEHASIYMLEVDDDSRLGRELLQGGARYHAGAVPKDDTIATMFEIANELLSSSALNQYEISNYALAGRESKHNMKYWLRHPYLGIGLDAHSMLRSQNRETEAVRFGYADDLPEFLGSLLAWENVDRLTPRAELEESWFLGLRLSTGVRFRELQSSYGGTAIAPFLATLRELENDGIVLFSTDTVRLSDRGKLLSNEVFRRILEVGDEEFCPAN